MDNEIILKSGWIKIDQKELAKLKESMRQKYEDDGGTKKFNSHLPNYEELRKLIRAKISDLKANYGYRITIQGQEYYDIVPGNTFFRDLYYTKKDADSPQFQEYNIDICYLYVYGKTRFEVLKQNRNQHEKIKIAEIADSKGIRIILSSTLNNMTEQEKIKTHLLDKLMIPVEAETRNSTAYSKGKLEDLYNGLDDNTYVFTLLSRDYLQNENCVKELLEYVKNNPDKYFNHTLHILLKDIYEGDFNIYDSLGRSELLKYWKLRIERLEENHKLLIGDKKEKNFYRKLRKELDELKEIIEELHNLLDLIRETPHAVLYEIFLNKISTRDEIEQILPKIKNISSIDSRLETIYKRIKIPSTNNPNKPEFPPQPFYKPKFPATKTYKIEVPGFDNVYMKDESTNPTGTHKDRMAWEVVIKYRSLIEGLKYKTKDSLPQMCIISSGSAAIAIQHLFNLYSIPTKLKVLVDMHLSDNIKQDIIGIGCEMYEYDLSEKLLSSDDIKELTDNKNGIDITYREVLDPAHDNYYDWMSYEILMEKPDYCFIPFGTGDLFINVLNIVKSEYFNSYVSKHDPRFFSSMELLKNCHFLGASTNHPDSKMEKLFSNFLPTKESFKKYIREMIDEYGCVGDRTDFYYVEEKFVEQAIEIAESQKIRFEPSGLGGLALMLQMKGSIPKDKKILIVNTGRTKKMDEIKD
jgi:cysteine synthase